MKNVKSAVKLGFVVVMVLLTVAFSGCVSKQGTIHSTVNYQTAAVATSLEIIPENNTPLSAPRVINDTTVETIAFSCEYVAD